MGQPALCSGHLPLASLSPFGNGNPEPMLASYGLMVKSADMVGNGHLRMVLAQNGRQAQAIGFNWAGMTPSLGEKVDMAFTPRVSNFGHPHIQMVMEDMRPNC